MVSVGGIPTPTCDRHTVVCDGANELDGPGYQHRLYAASFFELGCCRRLPHCGGWVLVRPIPCTDRLDAMGLYPFFCCRDWSQLAGDIGSLGDQVVCLSLVTDPFGDHDEHLLRDCFPEVHRPFKEHFVVDLRQHPDEFLAAHHRRNIAKASDRVAVEQVSEPSDLLEEWVRLYGVLCQRHDIRGMTAFSKASFERQLKVPGIIVLRATYAGETVGILLWYASAKVAYYHLGAYTERGYQLRASFALFWHAINYFREAGFSWLSLGAGAGAQGDKTDGLTRFKAGWSTGTRTAYFCGRVFDRAAYERLCGPHAGRSAGYFPQYRAGEYA